MSFGESLSIIVEMYTSLETTIGTVSHLKTFSKKVKSENLDSESENLPPEWPTRGTINTNGVSASYS